MAAGGWRLPRHVLDGRDQSALFRGVALLCPLATHIFAFLNVSGGRGSLMLRVRQVARDGWRDCRNVVPTRGCVPEMLAVVRTCGASVWIMWIIERVAGHISTDS